jgi:hypothetical protein
LAIWPLKGGKSTTFLDTARKSLISVILVGFESDSNRHCNALSTEALSCGGLPSCNRLKIRSPTAPQLSRDCEVCGFVIRMFNMRVFQNSSPCNTGWFIGIPLVDYCNPQFIG